MTEPTRRRLALLSNSRMRRHVSAICRSMSVSTFDDLRLSSPVAMLFSTVDGHSPQATINYMTASPPPANTFWSTGVAGKACAIDIVGNAENTLADTQDHPLGDQAARAVQDVVDLVVVRVRVALHAEEVG